MEFTMKFNMDNAAFDGDKWLAASKILIDCAYKLRSDCGDTSGTLRDINGNKTGEWSIE